MFWTTLTPWESEEEIQRGAGYFILGILGILFICTTQLIPSSDYWESTPNVSNSVEDMGTLILIVVSVIIICRSFN